MLPSYLENLSLFDLSSRYFALLELQKECRLCPNECLANRLDGETGNCHSTDKIYISSFGPHFGEESPLVGNFGSGAVFFTNCNLSCLYCQNYDISQLHSGTEISVDDLAKIFLDLQGRGCHNINLVTPTHYIPQIVLSLSSAAEAGLEIPLVYNCGGYESVEVLKLLENIVDIYMPDIKYSDNIAGLRFSGVENYWDVVKSAVIEMQRQVGDLKISARGLASRGLLIRHLVLPNQVSASKNIIDFIAGNVSKSAYVNIMDQYRPSYQALNINDLSRCVYNDEYQKIVQYAKTAGLYRGLHE